ncbi:NAD(P)-dependent oxidoreductase [Acidimangrovimonas sediminis]|uniref:NAD(P)-dependent oxidoreductase n=1 Tax=Acidimangrovimonas sediminis TaxID=2056283 RepID=UPI000C80BE9B|nr:NAD(P)-dependent oxidoreductase [Acidimangrovimonas sediminis]
MSSNLTGRDIGFAGFGEAASAFARGWGGEVCTRVAAYDLKLEDPAQAAEVSTRAEGFSVAPAPRAEVLRQARAVFCLVTADEAAKAAEEAAPLIVQGTLWLDGNSVAPETKARAARALGQAGADYVDMAIMAPVHPRLHKVPLLISGPGAARALPLLESLGMEARMIDDRVGSASAIKMIRSVMIKGTEALFAECLLAARRAGVEGEVIGSLAASNPETDWPRRGAYNLERMMVHGGRRAAEMREVAKTVAGLGLSPGLSSAAADWQARIGALGLEPGAEDLAARLDAVLAAL